MSHQKIFGIGRTAMLNSPSCRVITPRSEDPAAQYWLYSPGSQGFNAPLVMGSKLYNGPMAASATQCRAIEAFSRQDEAENNPFTLANAQYATASVVDGLFPSVAWRCRHFSYWHSGTLNFYGPNRPFATIGDEYPGWIAPGGVAITPGIDRLMASWYYYDLFQTANIYGANIYRDPGSIPWPPDNTWAVGVSWLQVSFPVPFYPSTGFSRNWDARSVSVAFIADNRPGYAAPPSGPQVGFFGQGESQGVSVYGLDDGYFTTRRIYGWAPSDERFQTIPIDWAQPSNLPASVADWRDNHTGTFYGRLTYLTPGSIPP